MPCHARKLSYTNTILYEARVTEHRCWMKPAATASGPQTPTFMNFGIYTCDSVEIFIPCQIYTESASLVASSMVAQCSVLPTSIATAIENTSVPAKTGMKDVSMASNSIGCAATNLTASDLTGQARAIESVILDPVRVSRTDGVWQAPRRLCDKSALFQLK